MFLHVYLAISLPKNHGGVKAIESMFKYSQLSPEIFDPRKMDANFLEANFEYFRL